MKTEAVTPRRTVERLLAAAGDDLILVGGQALAIWIDHYALALPADLSAVSSDTDFLARSATDVEAVYRMAEVLHGKTQFPHRRALTALIGQAYLSLNEGEFINVDVLHKVVGLTQSAVRKRAVQVTLKAGPFRVMHPLDVLHSRLANVYRLPEKQDAKGRMQLALSIEVGREFMRAEARAAGEAAKSTRSPLQPYVSEVERLALGDAGRKVAKRFGLHVADAIDPQLIPAGTFWERKWPDLSRLMSPSYAARFTPPAS